MLVSIISLRSQANHHVHQEAQSSLHRRQFLVASAGVGTALVAGCLDDGPPDETETGTESDEEEEEPVEQNEDETESDIDEEPEDQPSEPTDEEEPDEENKSEAVEEDNETELEDESERSVVIQEARWIGGEEEDERITVTTSVTNDGDVPLTIEVTAIARLETKDGNRRTASETETAERIEPGNGHDFLLSFSAPDIGKHVEAGETDGLVDIEVVAYEPGDDEDPIRTTTPAQYDRATAGAERSSALVLFQRLTGLLYR